MVADINNIKMLHFFTFLHIDIIDGKFFCLVAEGSPVNKVGG